MTLSQWFHMHVSLIKEETIKFNVATHGNVNDIHKGVVCREYSNRGQ